MFTLFMLNSVTGQRLPALKLASFPNKTQLLFHFAFFTGATIPQSDSVIVKQYAFGHRAESIVGAKQFWRTQFYLPDSQFVKFNFSVPSFAVLGVYLRRSTHPTHTQYDMVHILDGSTIASENKDGGRSRRAAIGSEVRLVAMVVKSNNN